jgi:hypothetical protein
MSKLAKTALWIFAAGLIVTWEVNGRFVRIYDHHQRFRISAVVQVPNDIGKHGEGLMAIPLISAAEGL